MFGSLLEGLCSRFPRIARDVWIDRFERGMVTDAHGSPLRADDPYRVGDEIRYFREVAAEAAIPFHEAILHVDEHLLVADKPHFLPVSPVGAYVRETLLARLIASTGNAELVPLHRIDRETAGLVLFSCQRATRGRYQMLFAQRRIEKIYEALAPPLPDADFPLRRATRLVRGEPFYRMCEADGVANGETLIDVIERSAHRWRYRLQPVTGRTHQLRVHMAALGAPIVGDSLYPELARSAANDYSQPLQLLAAALAFDDPIDGSRRCFASALRLPSGTL